MTLKVEKFESESGLAVKGIIPLPDNDAIHVAELKFVYLVLDRTNCSSPFPQAKVKASLSMTITEIDVDTEDEVGSYEEDYDLTEVSVAIRDYMKSEVVPTG